MKKKIVSILVCMLLCVTVLSVTGTEIKNDLSSAGRVSTPIKVFETNNDAPQMLGRDTFYAFNSYPGDESVWFDSSNPGVLNTIAPNTAPDFIPAGTWADGTWYVSVYGSGALYTVDPSTGTMTLIGGGVSGGWNGIAYDDNSETLYGAASTAFYTIDIATGSSSFVGNFGIGGELMIDIAIDNNGNCYGHDIATDSIYSIDLSSGSATLIGSTGLAANYAQGMEYDKVNEVLYLAGYTASGSLYTCDVNTGWCTLVGAFQGGAEVTGLAIPYTTTNEPPLTPPAPDGPDDGTTGVEYTFTTSTDDPELDQVYYWFDWDDGTNSGWVGPYNSGETGNASHAWDDAGDYEVTVKAKDTNDGESDWSPAHTISIVAGSILDIGTITGGLFKVSAPIENTGSAAATNVQWTIALVGGAFIGGSSSGTEPSIAAAGSVTVQSGLIIGLGSTTVTVTATCDEGSSDTKSQTGFVFLIFIKVNPGGG